MTNSKYQTIPVDPETKRKLEAICQAHDMGRRSQGAMVRKLVNAEYGRLEASRLIAEAGTLKTSEPELQPEALQ